MLATISHAEKSYQADLSKPVDISIALRKGTENVNAWYGDPVKIEPVRIGDWVGDVNEGGSVNFRNVFFNPHANGTHTECVGHISKENYSVNQSLKNFFFLAKLITVKPHMMENGDKVIVKEQISIEDNFVEALIIRTSPNEVEKIDRQYSNTNPAYLHHEAADFVQSSGIKHLLIDLPSVDKERDDGKLLAHRAFWRYPEQTREDCTITELIYVPDNVADGLYLLNLQIASFENDASPSKPVLYALINNKSL